MPDSAWQARVGTGRKISFCLGATSNDLAGLLAWAMQRARHTRADKEPNASTPENSGARPIETPAKLRLREAFHKMKTKSIVIATVALLGALSSASALTLVTPSRASAAPVKFEAPVPTSIVQPTDLPSSFMGKVVEVALTVDADGQAQDVKVLRATDKYLRRSLKAAVSQWKFTPARKNGVPVSSKVILPLELTES